MPRSGTTLLARTLGECLKIHFSPETHYFTYAYRGAELATDQLPREVLKDLRVERAYKRISGKPKNVETFRELLREILGIASVIGEKTPAHLIAFEDILSQDANVTCLVILRNFFEVTESLRMVHWNNASFTANLRRCARYHRITSLTQRKFPGRVFVVSYRALCEDSEGVMAALSSKLPRGNFSGEQSLFDVEVEPWKRDALLAPCVRRRNVPPRRIPSLLMARAVQRVCQILWPVKLVEIE